MNFIALGSNQLRFSSFQFANLWPKQRTTVLISYSAGYSISTTLFLLVQVGEASFVATEDVTGFAQMNIKLEFKLTPSTCTEEECL